MSEDSPSAVKLMQVNEALEQELHKWDRDKVNIGAFQVNTINLDNQIWGLVEYLKVLVPDFDEIEYEYRWKSRMLLKINELRKEVVSQRTAAEITQGIIGPDGTPIQVPKNHG